MTTLLIVALVVAWAVSGIALGRRRTGFVRVARPWVLCLWWAALGPLAHVWPGGRC